MPPTPFDFSGTARRQPNRLRSAAGQDSGFVLLRLGLAVRCFGRRLRCRRGHFGALRLRCQCRRQRLDLVLAHVVVHLAPAGEDRSLVGALVERETVLDGTAGVPTRSADGFAFGLTLSNGLLGGLAAEHVAAREQRASDEQREKGADHGW